MSRAGSLAQLGSFGALLIQFLLTVVVRGGALLRTARRRPSGALRFGRRLAGKHGEGAIRLSAQAIRGVALGVVLTALLQALIGGIGLPSPACRSRRC